MNPMEQFNILVTNSHFSYLNYPIKYAGAICPKCHTAHGVTTVVNHDKILWDCSKCHLTITDNTHKFQYWWYHKPMLIARIKIFDIDITLSGGDHYSEGDFSIRKAFIEKYIPTIREPYMLFTPTIISPDGQKMSKSRNNTEYANIPKLIKYSDKFMGHELKLSNKLIENIVDEKYYCYIL